MDTGIGATEPLPNFEATAQGDTAFSESCVKATSELVTPLFATESVEHIRRAQTRMTI